MTRKWASSIIHQVVKTIFVQSAGELPFREHLFFARKEKKTHTTSLKAPRDSNVQWPTSDFTLRCSSEDCDKSQILCCTFLSSSFLFSFLLDAHFPVRKQSQRSGTLFLPSFPSLHPLCCSRMTYKFGEAKEAPCTYLTRLFCHELSLQKSLLGSRGAFPAVSSCCDDQQHVALISTSTKGFTHDQ